jgi:hypothetical protein
MKFSFIIIVAFGYVSPVLADNLADIRQDLANLLLETDRLQLEMLTTPGIDFSNEGSLLDRASAIEGELQRLTGATEESTNRISIVVQDVYRRIKTLETSVCALESGCNVTELGASLPVGVISNGLMRTSMLEETLTITEKSDFDAVTKILVTGLATLDLIFRLEHLPKLGEKYLASEGFLSGGGNAGNAAVATAM